MKHARHDYDRIQDPAGKIPQDEPVFLLRGQDVCAPAAIRTWCQKAQISGVSQDMIDAAMKQADDMEAWQTEHAEKVPDLPAQAEEQPNAAETFKAEQESIKEGHTGPQVAVFRLIDIAGGKQLQQHPVFTGSYENAYKFISENEGDFISAVVFNRGNIDHYEVK